MRRRKADREAITAYCGKHSMPVIGVVPYEEEFVAAERAAKAPADFAPRSAGMRAIEAVAERLIALETTSSAAA